MNVEINFLNVFLFGVSIQGLFLFSVLLIKGVKLNQISYFLLSTLVFLFTFYLFKAGVSSAGLIKEFPHLVVTGFLVLPAVAPLFYLYLCSILNIDRSMKLKLLHWAFFIIQTTYWAPFFLSSAEWKFGVLRGEIDSVAYSNNVGLIFEVALVLQNFIYVYLLWLLIKKKTDSNSSIDSKWVQKVVLFFTIYAVTFSLGTLSFRFMNAGMPDYIFYTVIAVFIYLIGYYGYLQRDFLHELQTGDKPKYLFTNIDSNESKALYKIIMTLMKEENLFLQRGLKINDLARILKKPVNHISRAINENHLGNFNDLVNGLRIEQAKTLLSDRRNKDKLFAIALNSGFSNKVSFYKNFKRLVGKSPSDYRIEAQENGQSRFVEQEN